MLWRHLWGELRVALGVILLVFDVPAFVIHWSMWRARHSEGTRAAQVTLTEHAYRFSLNGLALVVAVLLIASGLRSMRTASPTTEAIDRSVAAYKDRRGSLWLLAALLLAAIFLTACVM